MTPNPTDTLRSDLLAAIRDHGSADRGRQPAGPVRRYLLDETSWRRILSPRILSAVPGGAKALSALPVVGIRVPAEKLRSARVPENHLMLADCWVEDGDRFHRLSGIVTASTVLS